MKEQSTKLTKNIETSPQESEDTKTTQQSTLTQQTSQTKINKQEALEPVNDADNSSPKQAVKLTKKESFIQILKFVAFSISAGIIQFVLTAILEIAGLKNNLHWIAYGIGLVASVIWNFTFNRKYTFKSANNVPIAMLLVACYYAVFAPLSVWGDKELVAIGCPGLASTAIFMIINFVTEFIYDRFVVFRKSINTNELSKKQKQKTDKKQLDNKQQDDKNQASGIDNK